LRLRFWEAQIVSGAFMNVGLVMVVSIGILLLGYRFYSRFVARHLGVDPSRPTPATQINDGVDYVPTKPLVLFGHHFASIAAAGPIIGPSLAILYGVLPAWLWIVVGVVFIGAVHDFTALFVTVRQGGKSVAEVARSTLGTRGFVLYVMFAILLCILVAAAFLGIAVEALTSHYALADLGLAADQKIFRTIDFNGETHALTGGIATVSVIVITLAAPLIGWLLYRRGMKVRWGSLLALAICVVSVWMGFRYQLLIDPRAKVWGLMTADKVVLTLLLAYCFLATRLPVWTILQPRDFVNVHILYIGLATMVLGLIACGIGGVQVTAPLANIQEASAKPQLGLVWPFLFVTIACGACSGAHGLICGGTSCKQLSNEKHAPVIGYGAMLLEALLGVCVILMIIGPLGFAQYRHVVWPETGGVFAVKGFALAVGSTVSQGAAVLGWNIPLYWGTMMGIILLEGFVLTTTDTVLRLTRYLFEELWHVTVKSPPAWLTSRSFNSLLPIGIAAWLAFTNRYGIIWPIFGTANQLLAALTLIAATAWLAHRAKKIWFVAIPALFMSATTITSLVFLLPRYFGWAKFSESLRENSFGAALAQHLPRVNWPLTVTDIVLMILAVGVVMLTMRQMRAGWKLTRSPSAVTEAIDRGVS
jgi:carbon starvation protein